MRYPRLMKIVISILTCGLLSFSTCVQAAVPEDAANRITLEKTVEFEDPQGEEVLVEPGTYTVTGGKETLSLTNNDSNISVTIEADETSHEAEIQTPSAASIPGQEGPLANTHIVMLFPTKQPYTPGYWNLSRYQKPRYSRRHRPFRKHHGDYLRKISALHCSRW